jgi:hypothetical protein
MLNYVNQSGTTEKSFAVRTFLGGTGLRERRL